MVYTCPCEIGECVLCEAKLFSGLSSTLISEIRGLLTKQSFRAHDVLVHQEDSCLHLFVLRTGQVKLVTTLPDGREQILGLRVAGQLVGFETVDDAVYPYTAVALTSVTTCRISHKDMLLVLQQNPSVALRVIRWLQAEIELAQALICDLQAKNAHEKVASFLLSSIPPNGPFPDSFPLLLSRQEIGRLLGLTEETVSRVISGFGREGLVSAPRGSVHVLNLPRLREIASGNGGTSVGEAVN